MSVSNNEPPHSLSVHRGVIDVGPQDSTGRGMEDAAHAGLFGVVASGTTLEAGRDPVIRSPSGHGLLPRGTTVDRYVLLDKLGAGGMGIVYAAYDPELDRKVALKLVLPGRNGIDGERGRLLREAQALARLTHPNVVAVHDVGTHDDQVWIAMEFVPGQTLGAWAKERSRHWTELLRVLTDVVRGVAAAHAVGLVHRDLKPENVMLGRDGRVRVMDFGLAHGRTLEAAERELAANSAAEPSVTSGAAVAQTLPTDDPLLQPEFAALALRLTQVGSIQGTPAYMAPEQWRGEEATVVADQFGWSVMAWELFFGERPFAGATIIELAKNVVSGQRRPSPRSKRVPGWLRKVVERGLTTEPSQRWPSMAALLAKLERGRTRARVQMTGALLAVAGVLGAGVAGYDHWDTTRRVATCEAAGHQIDAAWNGDARERLRAAFRTTGLDHAAATADKVIPWLDRYADAWRDARTEACMNADVNLQWDMDTLDRSVWCLGDNEIAMASLVAELMSANATVVDKAVTSVASLRQPRICTDEDLLRRRPAPPEDVRETVRAVSHKLAQARFAAEAGRVNDALRLTGEAREQAEEVSGWPRLRVAARAQEGWLAGWAGKPAEAETATSAAYFEAAEMGAWEVAAGAALDLIAIVGYDNGRYETAYEWGKHAKVAIGHAGDPVGLWEAARLDYLGSIYRTAGSYREARTLQEGALAIKEAALGVNNPCVITTLNNLANTHGAMGAYGDARRFHERVLAIREEKLGADHPDIGISLNNLGNTLRNMGAFGEARAMHERALVIWQKALGTEHPMVAISLNNLAAVLSDVGQDVEAAGLHERALAIRENALGPDHPQVAESLGNLGNILRRRKEYDGAKRMLERALEIRQKSLPPDHPHLADSLTNLALVLAAIGDVAGARALHQRALTIDEKALGADHPNVASGLYNLAELDIAEDRLSDAIVQLDRAVAIFERSEGIQEGELDAYFSLAKALRATGGDRARVIMLATRTCDGYRAAGEGRAQDLAAVEKWLDEYVSQGQ